MLLDLIPRGFNAALWLFRLWLLARCLYLFATGAPGPAFAFFCVFALAAWPKV